MSNYTTLKTNKLLEWPSQKRTSLGAAGSSLFKQGGFIWRTMSEVERNPHCYVMGVSRLNAETMRSCVKGQCQYTLCFHNNDRKKYSILLFVISNIKVFLTNIMYIINNLIQFFFSIFIVDKTLLSASVHITLRSVFWFMMHTLLTKQLLHKCQQNMINWYKTTNIVLC